MGLIMFKGAAHLKNQPSDKKQQQNSPEELCIFPHTESRWFFSIVVQLVLIQVINMFILNEIFRKYFIAKGGQDFPA